MDTSLPAVVAVAAAKDLPLFKPFLGPSLPLFASLLLWSCGDHHRIGPIQQKANNRRTNLTDTPSVSPSLTAKLPLEPNDAKTGSSGLPAAVGADTAKSSAQIPGSDSLDVTAAFSYYQADPSLADLFDPISGSQLCWPAALAYELEYKRHVAKTAKLPNPTQSVGSPSPADVRYYAKTCKTNLQTGTTVPEAVACIESEFSAAGYDAQVSVTGLDAKWSHLGLYSQNVTAVEHAPDPADVMHALKRGQSVILMLGFYIQSGNKSWMRISGHFLSVTGYSQTTSPTGGPKLEFKVVNPAVDYRARASGIGDTVLVRASDELSIIRAVGRGAYQLEGLSSDYLTVIETIIAF